MLKTNRSPKSPVSVSFAIGVATVASLGGSILVAPSAQAANVGYFGPANGILSAQPVTILDKVFSDFTDLTGNVLLSNNELAIIETNGSWSVNIDFQTSNQPLGVGAGTYTYRYRVTIDPTTPFTFNTVGFDTLVNTTLKQVSGTKTIRTNTGDNLVLDSINGSSDLVSFEPGVKWIEVTDSITVLGQGQLFEVTNSFTQKEVPEPGTVLGLLAVGGIGFISRFRKQK